MGERIEEIRKRFTSALQAVREPSDESEAVVKRWMDHVAPDTEFLLAEVDRLNAKLADTNAELYDALDELDAADLRINELQAFEDDDET